MATGLPRAPSPAATCHTLVRTVAGGRTAGAGKN
jgi:hypothetical protein